MELSRFFLLVRPVQLPEDAVYTFHLLVFGSDVSEMSEMYVISMSYIRPTGKFVVGALGLHACRQVQLRAWT